MEKFKKVKTVTSYDIETHIDIDKAITSTSDLVNSILAGTHPQFVYDTESGKVKCKCGHNAVAFRDGYICGTITAYPCKYN